MLKVNKPLLVSLLAQVFSGFVFILVQVTMTYYLKYAFGAENLGTMSMLAGTVMISAILLATFLAQYLLKVLSPGVLMILAYAGSAIPLLILWAINLAGPITSKGLLIPLLALFFLANSLAHLPVGVISMECMDYNRLKIGKSMQGMINALGQLVSKIQSGLGAAVVGAILVGVVDTMGRFLLPQLFGLVMNPSQAGLVGGALASMLIYIVMAVVLAMRPQGLFPAAKG